MTMNHNGDCTESRPACRGRRRDPAQAAECFFGTLNGHILIRNMMGLQNHWDEDALQHRAEVCVTAFLETHRVTTADP